MLELLLDLYPGQWEPAGAAAVINELVIPLHTRRLMLAFVLASLISALPCTWQSLAISHFFQSISLFINHFEEPRQYDEENTVFRSKRPWPLTSVRGRKRGEGQQKEKIYLVWQNSHSAREREQEQKVRQPPSEYTFHLSRGSVISAVGLRPSLKQSGSSSLSPPP